MNDEPKPKPPPFSSTHSPNEPPSPHPDQPQPRVENPDPKPEPPDPVTGRPASEKAPDPSQQTHETQQARDEAKQARDKQGKHGTHDPDELEEELDEAVEDGEAKMAHKAKPKSKR